MLPFRHPRTSEYGAITTTEAITATGAIHEADGSTLIAGIGQIAGFTAVMGNGGKIVVRDTDANGAAILTILGAENTRVIEHLPADQWRAFAAGFHVTITGVVIGVAFDIFRPA